MDKHILRQAGHIDKSKPPRLHQIGHSVAIGPGVIDRPFLASGSATGGLPGLLLERYPGHLEASQYLAK